MKLFDWLFSAAVEKAKRRVKWVEGTELMCPRCHMTIAVAKRDTYVGDPKNSADWSVRHGHAFRSMRHCGLPLNSISANGTEKIFTPTGWVG